MTNTVLDFYEPLAEYYHLIFEDWNQAIARQATVLNPLLHSVLPTASLKLLDCACGIGTQAIGFAQAGHRVSGSDLSPAAIGRAQREAELRGLPIAFTVSDMTSLAEVHDSDFDVAAALDNALPHLDPEELKRAAYAMAAKLRCGGVLLASIRDYDQPITQRPPVQQPAFYGDEQNRRIVHQVWDWLDRDRYVVHMYITLRSGSHWESHHFASRYRALPRAELTAAVEGAGLKDVRWIMPEESRYYQPILIATKV